MSVIPKRESIPIVAPTSIPFQDNDKPDFTLLEKNVSKWVKTGLSGFVVGSYGGEEFHLSDSEKILSVTTVSEAHEGQKFVIAGIDTPSPTVAVHMTESYAAAGADMVRIRIPENKKDRSSETLIDYFETVSKYSPLPIIVIHQPRQSATNDATHEEIGAVTQLDNIYAYIISLNYRWECRAAQFVDPSVQLWTCNGSLLLPGAMMGADGACCFFANWAPETCREVIKLVKCGDYKAALSIQNSLYHADSIGMTRGVAAQKAGLNLLGYDSTQPRRPTRSLTSKELSELKLAFQQAKIL